jgi:hypothetical protein
MLELVAGVVVVPVGVAPLSLSSKVGSAPVKGASSPLLRIGLLLLLLLVVRETTRPVVPKTTNSKTAPSVQFLRRRKTVDDTVWFSSKDFSPTGEPLVIEKGSMAYILYEERGISSLRDPDRYFSLTNTF